MKQHAARLLNIVPVTSNHIVLIGEDLIEADATGGAIQITLFSGEKLPGAEEVVKRMNVGLGVTVVVDGGGTMDGAATVSLLTQYSSKTFYAKSDGNWGIK